MTTRGFICNWLATCLCLISFAALAHAQTAQRTFVSTSGNDANTASLCSATSPCRGFAAALSVTTAGGEIVPLASGGYGSITITKSVQIVAPSGVYAAITASSGNAITVNAGTNDTVVLRGLTINGLGAGATGIRATTFKTLHIENCTVSNFTVLGIIVDAGANNMRVYVKDTIVRNNGDNGLFFRNSTGTLYVSVDRTRAEGNGQSGFLANNNSRVTIANSIASGNANHGFVTFSDGNDDPAVMNCDNCVASNNANGFTSTLAIFGGVVGIGNSTMRVARSTATNNLGAGFLRSSVQSGEAPVFESLQGTNLVRGNATNRSGTITNIDPDAP